MLKRIRLEYKIVEGSTFGRGNKKIKTDMMYMFFGDIYFLYYTGKHKKCYKRQSWVYRFIHHLPIDDWIAYNAYNGRRLIVSKTTADKEGYKECYVSVSLFKRLFSEIRNPEIIEGWEV